MSDGAERDIVDAALALNHECRGGPWFVAVDVLGDDGTGVPVIILRVRDRHRLPPRLRTLLLWEGHPVLIRRRDESVELARCSGR